MGPQAAPTAVDNTLIKALRALVLLVVCLGVVLVLGERLWLAAHQPLWLDETWTAAIVSPPDSASFWREVYLDSNAPLYYALMRPWIGLFGLGDLALRLPGLISVALAGVILARAQLPGLSREARWCWAALVFFWWGVGVFLDARCYGLLLALSAAQAVAYGRLMYAPTLKRTVVWVALCGLAVLCQYYAMLICLAQGLLYLAVYRGKALRTAPALLLLAPVVAWMVHHEPRLMDYARPDVAWHDLVNWRSGLYFAGFPLGAVSQVLAAAAILVVILAGLGSRLGRARTADSKVSPALHLWAIVACGVLALALTLASGVWRPSLTSRYLIPLTPSILLGLVLCARATRGARIAYAGLALLYLAFAANPLAVQAQIRAGTPYGNDQASDDLAAQGVTDVVFIWDHPVSPIIDPGSLRRVGGVLFARNGHPVRVIPLQVKAGDDANRLALAAATGARPGLIWVYDRDSRTAARSFPPRLAQLDPRWSCRTYGDTTIGTVACYRRSAP